MEKLRYLRPNLIRSKIKYRANSEGLLKSKRKFSRRKLIK